MGREGGLLNLLFKGPQLLLRAHFSILPVGRVSFTEALVPLKLPLCAPSGWCGNVDLVW